MPLISWQSEPVAEKSLYQVYWTLETPPKAPQRLVVKVGSDTAFSVSKVSTNAPGSGLVKKRQPVLLVKPANGFGAGGKKVADHPRLDAYGVFLAGGSGWMG